MLSHSKLVPILRHLMLKRYWYFPNVDPIILHPSQVWRAHTYPSMGVFRKVCKPSLWDRYWHLHGPATPVELRQQKESKGERREESSRLHTGGGTVRWIRRSMAEKGRGHEMKLLLASTGTALPLWAFKVPSRKIPFPHVPIEWCEPSWEVGQDRRKVDKGQQRVTEMWIITKYDSCRKMS